MEEGHGGGGEAKGLWEDLPSMDSPEPRLDTDGGAVAVIAARRTPAAAILRSGFAAAAKAGTALRKDVVAPRGILDMRGLQRILLELCSKKYRFGAFGAGKPVDSI